MNILKYLMKEFLDKGCDDVVLNLSNAEGVQIKFANSKIAKTGLDKGEHLGIYATRDKRRVATVLKEFDKKAADILVKKTIDYLRTIPAKEDYYGINDKKFRYSKTKDGYERKRRK